MKAGENWIDQAVLENINYYMILCMYVAQAGQNFDCS